MVTPGPLPLSEWPYLTALVRLSLALALGLFVGLERERRRKEAGVRTFAFAALLGCLGGLLGESYALLALILLGVLIVFLNLQSMRTHQDIVLTTSAALLVIGFAGVLCGHGHTLTPAAVAVLTAAAATLFSLMPVGDPSYYPGASAPPVTSPAQSTSPCSEPERQRGGHGAPRWRSGSDATGLSLEEVIS